MKITLLLMEKSWNCVFEFLWEPCLLQGLGEIDALLKLPSNTTRMLLFCVSSSLCSGLFSSVWLWYFLYDLTHYDLPV